MGTPLEKVYSAFLSKMLEDEWLNWTQEEEEEDLLTILDGALPWFKFPRKSLEHDEQCFFEELDNEEIQIIACYMKCEWLNRTILTWENVKPLYEERDFSQANLIGKFTELLRKEEEKVHRLEGVYYRAPKRKPFSYRLLAEQYQDV